MLLCGIGAVVAAMAPNAVFPQSSRKLRRIGLLYSGSKQSAMDTGRYPALIEGLNKLGYVEGRDFVMESRFSDGSEERLVSLAKELVRSKPDVIIAARGAVLALQQVGHSIPIVMPVSFDPVREGFAASLAHPGGNITGISALLEDIFPKHVDLLKAAMPKLSRVAVLSSPEFVEHPPIYKQIEANAKSLGIEVRQVSARRISEIDAALAAAANQHAQALIILGNSAFVQEFHHIAEFALKHRLATVYSGRELPQAGGLMSYGPDFRDNYRHAAVFVDRILKGARPADMPFEQPTRFELTINLRTAKAIGVAIPKDLLARADEVIQ